jgi:hypothetical protein
MADNVFDGRAGQVPICGDHGAAQWHGLLGYRDIEEARVAQAKLDSPHR